MVIPEKLKIANLPTPIEKIKFDGSEFFIKRDDYTGIEFSGNKIRKLEYLLAEALSNKTEKIYTCGGVQSNHARATAFAAVKYGIKSKLYLRGEDYKAADGNLFLNKVLGTELKFVSVGQYNYINEMMLKDSENDSLKTYIIPEGGSNKLGAWGYVDFIKEFNNQSDVKKFDGILSACGSGGTTAGMLVGTQLLNLDLYIYAVNVSDDKDYFYNRIMKIVDEMISTYELDIKIDTSKLIILDGYSFEGYNEIEKKKLDLIKRFCQNTGILLDPVYTGKAFYAYWENFIKTKKSSRVLFNHTGGIFGAFARKKSFLD